jgi:hypothetical protein
MPLIKVQFKPGVNRETTSYGAEGQWYNSDLVRFRKGRPEKMGGWTRLSSNTIQGTGRSLHAWAALDGSKYMGLGTETKFYIENGGAYNDITPIRVTTSLGANPLKTGSATSGVVTVTALAHGAVTGDFVTLSGATTTDGITAAQLNTEQQLTIIDSNSYTIPTAGAASSGSTTGGGSSIVATYQINTGLDTFIAGNGFGAGLWGGLSTGYSQTTLNDSGGISDSDTTFILTSASDFETASTTTGADLTAASTTIAGASTTGFPSKGTIKIGSENIRYGTNVGNVFGDLTRGDDGTTAASSSSGATITFVGLVLIENELLQYTGKSTNTINAPTITRRIMVSGADRHIIAFGCNPQSETAQDLLMIRWSDQENAVNWTPAVTNSAGFMRISSGSEIVAAQKTRQEILIWTDVNLHAMRFIGGEYTFGISLLASNTSLIGPNAVVTVGDRVYWMDRENFYVYSGRIEIIPCTVLRYVFDDINLEQSHKCFAASNKMFDEVFWFYPSSGSDEIDRYVKYCTTEGAWDIGSLVRTAWVDYGIHNNPRASGVASGTQYIYVHESGDDDDGSAMTSYVESGDFDLGDGEQFMFLNRLIPDIDITSSDAEASVNYILKTRNYPGDSLTTNSTNAVKSTTQQAFLRGRSRQAVLRIESDTTNVTWTLGDLRLEIRPDGRR